MQGRFPGKETEEIERKKEKVHRKRDGTNSAGDLKKKKRKRNKLEFKGFIAWHTQEAAGQELAITRFPANSLPAPSSFKWAMFGDAREGEYTSVVSGFAVPRKSLWQLLPSELTFHRFSI